ncbi:hypothetical protein H072_2969 [Dactylellina haptotyla CBS 200.50]|uniref:Ig-like domain-containing protein n=1 Tax=Dactylellina haptotyla (strain CBS 200.50) TaxID=1284197 RepID=S8BU89_DACHA|nr:hypothetical protein H072_2969 [Dactylellina haptotyla CBS 200.50]
MKFAVVALALASAVSAELVFDNGEFKCLGDSAGKNFCAGDSLQTNIIIRCTGEKGQPGNCNDNLAGVPPVGVKTFAPCYQTSNTTGDAACSYNGIVYPDSGSSFPVPGSSSSSAAPTYGSATSSAPPVYTTVVPPPYTSLTSAVYSTISYSNTTATYLPPSSTLETVTGTVTVTTTCDTTTTTAGPTYVPPPAYNTTSYTTSLPIPTQAPNAAGALIVKDTLVLGAVALAGFLML